MNTRIKFLIPVAAVLLLVAAHQAQAITLVPPSLEFGGQKGQTITTAVKLYNEGNDPITLYPSTANFTAADENGTPSFDAKGTQTDLAGWIHVGQVKYDLTPGQQLEVPVTIAIPNDADPGGHYAALFFGTSAGAPAGGTVAVNSKIGTLIILRVDGAINESANVTSFKVTGGKSSFTHPPVQFDVRIKNDGNVHVRPDGTVDIHNMFGGQTASIPLNPTQGAILPNSARQFLVTWTHGQSSKSDFFSQVSQEWHNFGLGSYTASINATYGQSKQPLTATVKFTIFPWQLLLVIVLIIVIVVLLLTFGLKSYNQMIISRANQAGPKS